MAFSAAQKVQLRKWLGYPALDRDTFSHVESTFDTIGADAATQTEVEAILAQLVTIDGQQTSATATAGMKRAEEIEWYDGQARMGGIASRGRVLVQRLATIFNVRDDPARSDPFGDGTHVSHPVLLG